jgi:hypothetical protein
MKMSKEIIKIDRESMIEVLTQSMFDVMECDADYRWLLCQVGFKGYLNMTNPELMQEYQEYISEDENADIEIILQED